MISQLVKTEINNMDLGDLKTLNNLIKMRWAELDRRIAVSFEVGQEVGFTSRRGDYLIGSVIIISTRNVKVKVGTTTWTVSPSLLRPMGVPAKSPVYNIFEGMGNEVS